MSVAACTGWRWGEMNLAHTSDASLHDDNPIVGIVLLWLIVLMVRKLTGSDSKSRMWANVSCVENFLDTDEEGAPPEPAQLVKRSNMQPLSALETLCESHCSARSSIRGPTHGNDGDIAYTCLVYTCLACSNSWQRWANNGAGWHLTVPLALCRMLDSRYVSDQSLDPSDSWYDI